MKSAYAKSTTASRTIDQRDEDSKRREDENWGGSQHGGTLLGK